MPEPISCNERDLRREAAISGPDRPVTPEQLPSQSLCAVIGGYSNAGTKPRNDDAIAGRVPEDAYQRHLKGVVACIADGLSSAQNADRAAQMAVMQFTRDFYDAPESWTIQNCAARLLASLNSWFHSQNRSAIAESQGFATTFTAIVARATTAHIVHVGDTRCHRLRNGRLTVLTDDHSAPYLGQGDVLTRALGIEADIRVDYRQEPMQTGDVFLLTSDGVHGALAPAAIEQFLGEASLDSRKDLEEVSKLLCDKAFQAGSRDNNSCLIMRIESLPSETLAEAHGRLTRRAIPPVLREGNRLDGWCVTEVLHSSPRSHLYRVERADRDGTFVLKAPSANFAEDLRYLEGFTLEQWIGRRIQNRQIMHILPAEDTRFLYFVAEHVEGRTLRQWMAAHPDPSLVEIIPILASIVSAARVFHRMDIVHRDLKPENIIIGDDSSAKIIDFGSAQVTGFADLRSAAIEEWPEGSLNYIAPELLAGKQAENLSDLFSIAVIAWEMLTGTLPFDRESRDMAQAPNPDRMRGAFARARPDLSPLAGRALAKALYPQPSQRQQAMSEFIADLKKAETNAPLSTEFVPLIERGSKEMWRNWALIATLIALVMAVVLINRLG